MPNSLPSLVAGILKSNKTWHVASMAARFEMTPLVSAYQIDSDLPLADQADRAALAVVELAQKLTRLKDAYARWPAFDASPYFDLYPAHAYTFFVVEETPHAVRLRLYADLLLPAFRQAERYWSQSFLPAYHAAFDSIISSFENTTPGRTPTALTNGTSAFYSHLVDESMPRLGALLNEAEEAIHGTLRQLGDHLDVVGYLGGLEERIQHRPAPGFVLAPGLLPTLQRLPREMPTLTLDVLYPRHQQPSPERVLWPQQV